MTEPTADAVGDPVPMELVPGYETDPSAVGTNREVDPWLVEDEADWTVIHPEVKHDELVEQYAGGGVTPGDSP